MAGITGSIMARLANNETVRTDTLDKICSALNCRIEDIVEFIPDGGLSEDTVLKLYNKFDIYHDTIDLDTFRYLLRKSTESVSQNEIIIDEDMLIRLIKKEDNKRSMLPQNEKNRLHIKQPENNS